MSINVISEKEIAIVIGEGDIGMTGMISEGGLVGLVINQFKDKVDITDEHLTPEQVESRFDENAPIATLLFNNKTALQNMINILEKIKSHL